MLYNKFQAIWLGLGICLVVLGFFLSVFSSRQPIQEGYSYSSEDMNPSEDIIQPINRLMKCSSWNSCAGWGMDLASPCYNRINVAPYAYNNVPPDYAINPFGPPNDANVRRTVYNM